MTANLGLEAPGATPLLQNIILYPYVNPATEILDASGMPSSLDVTPISSAADGTQIWKITHNGVDTHPIHFHLYDVQVAQPGHLGQHHHSAGTDRARLEGHRAGQPARRHDRRPAPDRAGPSVRRARQQAPAQPDDAASAPGVTSTRPERHRGRLQQHRHQRQPDDECRSSTTSSELRVGVRLPLPHPQPRGDGHDEAGDGPRAVGRRRRRRRG